jgi:hypothetical protein
MLSKLFAGAAAPLRQPAMKIPITKQTTIPAVNRSALFMQPPS